MRRSRLSVTPSRLMVPVSRVIRELGMSRDHWNRLGDTGAVFCIREEGKHRRFDLNDCKSWVESKRIEPEIPDYNPETDFRAVARQQAKELRAGSGAIQ